VDIDIKSFQDTLQIAPQTIEPLTLEKIAPVAVHVNELNQIAPISVESLRVDQVRHVDPLRIDRLNITQLPSVSLSLSQLPSLEVKVNRLPPMAIALQQELELTSGYTLRARILGLDLMRMEICGTTRVAPRDCAHREQSRSHERSFPDVAAAGNPAIPSRAVKTCTQAVTRCPPPHRHKMPHHPLEIGAPRFNYSLGSPGGVAAASKPAPAASSVSFGG
jgi:hypothetical protein